MPPTDNPTVANEAPAPRSLDDFAPASSRACTVCVLPPVLLHELEHARTSEPKRFTYPIIAAWLIGEHQTDVSDSSLRRHFSHGHHKKAPAI